METFVAELAKGTDPEGPPTVARYAGPWLDKRTNTTANDDRTRIMRHVVPHIGSMLMAEVKVRCSSFNES